jgi:hypothetical protein
MMISTGKETGKPLALLYLTIGAEVYKSLPSLLAKSKTLRGLQERAGR